MANKLMCILIATLTIFGATSAAVAAPTRISQTTLNKLKSMIEAEFSKKGHIGMSIGIVDDQKLIYQLHLGTTDKAKQQRPNGSTLYQTASLTKVFTATLMMIMRDQGKLRIDQPLQQFVPPKIKAPRRPDGERLITLRHLATHFSGLPNLPPLRNSWLKPFSLANLFEALHLSGLDTPIGSHYQYSNFGSSMLGQAIARRAGKSYESLIHDLILSPLNMTSSGFKLTPGVRKRLAKSYSAQKTPRTLIDMDAMNPAGGLYSNIVDLAKFVAWQHRVNTLNTTPLKPGSLAQMHRMTRVIPPLLNKKFLAGVGLGWHVYRIGPKARVRVVWHNGALSGFRLYVGFLPNLRVGVIALTNTNISVDQLGLRSLKLLGRSIKTTTSKRPFPRIHALMSRLKTLMAPTPDSRLIRLFHPMLLEIVPPAQLLSLCAKIVGKFGTISSFKIGPHPTKMPRRAVATVTFDKGQKLLFDLTIDGRKNGALLTGFLVRAAKK